MSQPPEVPDPYLPPHQPYPPRAAGDAATGGLPPGYGPPQGYGARDPRSQAEVRADRPAPVVRLLQAMVVGAVLTVVQAVYTVLTIEQALQTVLPDIEQLAVDLGTDTATLADAVTTFGTVVLVTGAVLSTGLWLLFAWLFGRGQGRVVGTVLAGLNLVGSLFGLVDAVDGVDLLLRLLLLGTVAVALTLLWLPATTTWWRAVRDAGRHVPWS